MTKARKKIGNIPINTIKQDLQSTVDTSVAQMQQDVTDFIDKETSQYPEIGGVFKFQEDPEGRSEITADAEGKIISYRDSDGVKHEEVGVSINKLNLTDEGMSDFQKALKDSGFHGGADDWSDYISEDGDMPLCLPEPRCAIVNFVVDKLPTAKNVDYKGYVEFNDGLGNYFRKKAILNGQGASSIVYNNQKNIAIDFFDSDWDGDAFAVKFGNWVPQDSFHIKAFYMDPVRGLANVCYKYAEYVIQETNTRPNRLAREADKVTVNGDTGVITNDYDTGALCHPDGFPCLVYSNGEFMGIYAWNLKKHRANYMMDKKDYESVHVDPDNCNLWNLNPINWGGIELRNPKTLYCMDGSKYDGDAPKELIDSTSEYYDATNKDHKNTVKTKNIIVGLHDNVLAIDAAMSIVTSNGTIKIGAYDGEYSADVNYAKGHWVKDSDNFYMSIHSTNQGNPTSDENYWVDITQAIAAIRGLFEQTFDMEGFIIFWIVSQFMDNWDGMTDRNTQWLYYKKSKKWCPSFYDTDNCIGYCGYPWLEAPVNSFTLSVYYYKNVVNTWIWEFYHDEIVAKYNEIRQRGIISTEAYMKFYNDWCSRIDTSYIKANAEKWDVPCYRDGKIDTEHWKQIGIVGWGEVTYDENTDYAVGDEVTYGSGTYIRGDYVVKFRCIKACKGKAPCGSYPNMPQTGGTFDSPRRVKAWLDAKVEILDNLMQ